MKKIIVLFAILTLFTACKASPKFKVNDVVLADWYQGNWHIGRVSEVCEEGGNASGGQGWKVVYSDNFYNSGESQKPACYTEDRLIQNVAPSVDEIKAEDVVIAEWMEDAYYTAKVEKIDGDQYSVKFVSDGWESKLTLDKIRVLP